MTKGQWEAFSSFRSEFKKQCDDWNNAFSQVLMPFQKAASVKDTPEYPIETAVVYNKAFDEVTQGDDIKLIVIGDNPGKDEQLAKNNKYLVGQSGKIAEGFFRKNGGLGIDFRKNVLILNKTPVHTAKTTHLKKLMKEGGEEINKLILDSQLWMAEKTAALHQKLCHESDCIENTVQLWLVGYAELKNKGIFIPYRDELKNCYKENERSWKNVFVYQHFSMNRFLIDLSNFQSVHEDCDFAQALMQLGTKHKQEIFIL